MNLLNFIFLGHGQEDNLHEREGAGEQDPFQPSNAWAILPRL